jgi:hypothetical protein
MDKFIDKYIDTLPELNEYYKFINDNIINNNNNNDDNIINNINNKDKGKIINRPFESIIKTIQAKRKLYPKGTINNYLYKLMGNSIYGALVRGLGNKQRFDPKSFGTVRVDGNELTNPILAS